MNISYTLESIHDLRRLRDFIKQKNPHAAQKIASSIKKGINQLKLFPYLGVMVEKAPNPEIVRDLILGNYTVRYLIHSGKINILRIWHHKEEDNRL